MIVRNSENDGEECIWNEVFNSNERIILQQGFLITGIINDLVFYTKPIIDYKTDL